MGEVVGEYEVRFLTVFDENVRICAVFGENRARLRGRRSKILQ